LTTDFKPMSVLGAAGMLTLLPAFSFAPFSIQSLMVAICAAGIFCDCDGIFGSSR
jgi:hypothetical protein